MDYLTFTDKFRADADCVEYLSAKRWPHGTVCDKCGAVGTGRKTADPRVWFCADCRKAFSVTAGTPFERTHLPLPVWFAAIWLIGTSSKGVSAVVVSRQLGISYKSAWFLCHRIRNLLIEGDDTLKGVVEVDETYIGGKRRRDQTSKRDDDDDQPKGRGGSRIRVSRVQWKAACFSWRNRYAASLSACWHAPQRASCACAGISPS